MEWLLALVAVGGLAVGGRRLLTSRRVHREDAEELAGVRALADEDVTLLGEQLQRLDASVSSLDEEGRVDYQKALDAYESGKTAVERIRRPEEVTTVADTLSQGRYALACVQARLEGRPLPELRVPCFFNPQHGPSTEDVLYTAPGRGTRTVPACAQDAARVHNREQPEVRKVRIGSRTVPYWEAGEAGLPYLRGNYFGAVGSAVSLAWVLETPPMDQGWSGGPDHGGFLGGDGGGFDGGGFDGGGFDGGGGGDGGGG